MSVVLILFAHLIQAVNDVYRNRQTANNQPLVVCDETPLFQIICPAVCPFVDGLFTPISHATHGRSSRGDAGDKSSPEFVVGGR